LQVAEENKRKNKRCSTCGSGSGENKRKKKKTKLVEVKKSEDVKLEGIKLGNANMAKCGAIVDLDINILIYI
jgi:ribosomal protein S27AE